MDIIGYIYMQMVDDGKVYIHTCIDMTISHAYMNMQPGYLNMMICGWLFTLGGSPNQ